MPLLLLFVLTPMIELYLLFRVHFWMAESVGTFPALMLTLGTVFVTGVIGSYLAKSQGFLVFSRLRQKLLKREQPSDEVVEGIMILVGGVMLLSPGYLTDIIGLSCVFPWTRVFLRKTVMIYAKKLVGVGFINVIQYNKNNQKQRYESGGSRKADDQVIDIEEIQ